MRFGRRGAHSHTARHLRQFTGNGFNTHTHTQMPHTSPNTIYMCTD